MDYNKTREYLSLMRTLDDTTNISDDLLRQLGNYNRTIYIADLEDIYSEPMLVIGVWIAIASLVCTIAMGVDLLHGLRSKMLWFPCKWFSINSFYLTVIAVAMKLPVDLSGLMPGVVDQVAKLGSIAFMCTMMANLMPFLATMDSNKLLTNITALVVLVITLVVNVCIQISTGVVSSFGTNPTDDELEKIVEGRDPPTGDLQVLAGITFSTIAIIYITSLVLLLIIYVSSSLAILNSKQIIESKYQQQRHKIALKEEQEGVLSIEKLRQRVSNYWIMAGSGSPQFIITCAATTSASGVICVLTFILHTLTMGWTINHMGSEYESDYKWSTLLILMVQYIGVFVGTVAPFLRCFSALSFKVSIKLILNHINFINVESYWTQKLSDWKYKRFPFRFRSLNHKVVNFLKIFFLNCCIILQLGVVILCKMIAFVPFIVTIVFYYLHIAFTSPEEGTDEKLEQQYVLRHDSDKEFAESTLKRLSKSLNLLIQKSEKKHPINLMNLIKEKSTTSFQGVKKFANNDDCDCWSLVLVTLTTIADALCKIKKVKVDSLMKSLREGLEYVTLVEENLNTTEDYVKIQKATQRLWQEVYIDHKWLGINLQDIDSDQMNAAASQDDTTLQIVKFFFTKAKDKISEKQEGTTHSGCATDDPEFTFTSICAKSMYRITKTIIDDHKESDKKSFDELISSWIADIMAACLTNLPQVIEMKCHTNVIEKREVSVKVAAKLLGETKQIIDILRDHDVPSKSDRPFIDKWGAYLSEP